jgi:hypothetical protein
VSPTISVPVDGDPGQASTFAEYKLAFDQIAGAKQLMVFRPTP